MGGKTWEQLKLDVTLAVKPLLTRRNYYEDGAVKLRKGWVDFFLNEDIASSLVEVAKIEQQMFDFNLVKKNMAACLVNEEKLIEVAARLNQGSVAKSSLIFALDAQVLNCGLPFFFANDNYHLPFAKPFTPKAQNFMQQFAHALTLYRIYLHIFEVFHYLLNNPFLNTEQHSDCLQNALFFKARSSENLAEWELSQLLQQIKTSKQDAKSRLNLLHGYKADFERNFSSESPKLPLLFTLSAKKLERCYSEFPNDSWYTSFFYDNSWHRLLKNISANLFENQSTNSAKFTTKLNAELSDFETIVLDQLLDYKIALLSEALRIFDETMLHIRAKAAKTGVSLAYTSATNFFQPSRTIYHYMYQSMMERRLDNNTTFTNTPGSEEPTLVEDITNSPYC